jgi:hypothetical protein
MKKEIIANIVTDTYVCNAGFWTTDYHVETEGVGEDFEDLKKQFQGKRVKISIEEYMTPQERKEHLIAEFAEKKPERPQSIDELRDELRFTTIEVPEETLEERVFQLECQTSMQHDLILHLIDELHKAGITISTKLNYPEGD